MSYCRWSCDNYKSDVYVYASAPDNFVVCVCTSRYVPEPPPLADMETTTVKKFLESWNRQMKALEKATLVPIGGEYDGESFSYQTLEELFDGLLDIQAHGYHVPQHAFDGIREEIKEQKGDAK